MKRRWTLEDRARLHYYRNPKRTVIFTLEEYVYAYRAGYRAALRDKRK